jgi:HAMP domain-containing protein
VTRRLVPGGLRAQLALAIALVTAIAVGASFLALYNITSSRLRAQIDSQLRTQAAEWRQFTAHADFRTSAALERTASQFVAAQRYHAESLIIVVQASGGRTVNNNSELLAREEARERSLHETTGLLDSPTGLVTASVAEAGTMRVLAQPIDYGNRRVGTLRVANPLTPVQQAQASLRRAFLVVGVIALVLAIAAGIGLATLIAAPLRRMARVAAAVDAGDLSMRAGPVAARGEVRLLSEPFDRMLERLERAFRRQRDFVSAPKLGLLLELELCFAVEPPPPLTGDCATGCLAVPPDTASEVGADATAAGVLAGAVESVLGFGARWRPTCFTCLAACRTRALGGSRLGTARPREAIAGGAGSAQCAVGRLTEAPPLTCVTTIVAMPTPAASMTAMPRTNGSRAVRWSPALPQNPRGIRRSLRATIPSRRQSGARALRVRSLP